MLRKQPAPQQKQLLLKPTIGRVERQRLKLLRQMEEEGYARGYTRIAGVDEAGRGPLAGPVVAAACILPKEMLVEGVDDSKKLTAKKRRLIYERLVNDKRVQIGIGILSHEEIDQINIYQASIQAMLRAIAQLAPPPDFLLVDGNFKLPTPLLNKSVIGGDQLCHIIAAASVIAKETRDGLMEQAHQSWPDYGFDRHKGYGTPEHLAALAKHGPCPIHRRTFAPIAKKETPLVS